MQGMAVQTHVKYLEDRWHHAFASKLGAPELLRYRSNLLGSDLRMTNFGGGNTSSKLNQVDPMDGDESGTDEELRSELAQFYAKRISTHQPIDPKDCAQAILFLAGPAARCTTGHLIPVDGGLVEAYLR